MTQAPYQVTNIVFNKGKRFKFGMTANTPVNNMYFFEAAVRAENKHIKVPKELQDRPHEWNYAAMEKASKDFAVRRKLPRGMTSRRDPVVCNKIAELEATLKAERQRRQTLAPHYMKFLRLFDNLDAEAAKDPFEPIPLSSVARARRDKIKQRRQRRTQRPNLRDTLSRGRTTPSATQRLRGPDLKMSVIRNQILRAKGKKVPPQGVMSQTASRGLLN